MFWIVKLSRNRRNTTTGVLCCNSYLFVFLYKESRLDLVLSGVHTRMADDFCPITCFYSVLFICLQLDVKLSIFLNSADEVLLCKPLWMMSLHQVVDVSWYVRCRSSWLSLQGDPKLQNREAIGTRTSGTKHLIILKLTIRGRTHNLRQ